jgi:hypothetical protein
VTDPDGEISGEILKVKHQIEEVASRADQAKTEAEQTRRRGGYWWLVMVVTAVVGPALAIAFSAYNTDQSERKFCALITMSEVRAQRQLDTYRLVPPTTAAGRAQLAQQEVATDEIIKLRRGLGCPPNKGIGQ